MKKKNKECRRKKYSYSFESNSESSKVSFQKTQIQRMTRQIPQTRRNPKLSMSQGFLRNCYRKRTNENLAKE